MRVAVIGAGLTGLTAAIRLAETGHKVTIFEAAAQAGGRTRSFIDRTTGSLCDNGPHLVIGAYSATRKLLNDCQINDAISWQDHLSLPLWDLQRGHFSLTPKPWLPIKLALPLALKSLPGHNSDSLAALMRLAAARVHDQAESVASLLSRCRINSELIRDLIEPLCLGTMNAPINEANAASFMRVLKQSFASHEDARIGTFTAPLHQALIDPLLTHAKSLGVTVKLSSRIDHLDINSPKAPEINAEAFDHVITALPAYAADRLLGGTHTFATQSITNLHLWFDEPLPFATPFFGAIGTYSQWFFELSHLQANCRLQHLCVVISADDPALTKQDVSSRIIDEMQQIWQRPIRPMHQRLIREKRATVVVDQHPVTNIPSWLTHAGESPQPGDLPATIESAILRGENSASALI